MPAIIQTGGKQYLVSKGDKLQIEKLPGKTGDKISLDKVLLTLDGKTFKLGKPYLEKTAVEVKILKQGRGKKIEILKYKAKSRYRRHAGHRQNYTEVEILEMKK